MQKLKLNPEMLEVETFPIADGAASAGPWWRTAGGPTAAVLPA